MAKKEKKRRTEIQKFEYLKNEKSFLWVKTFLLGMPEKAFDIAKTFG